VLEHGAARNSMNCIGASEAEIKAAVLGSDAHVHATLKEFGGLSGPPWRIDEQLAARAAWLALAAPQGTINTP